MGIDFIKKWKLWKNYIREIKSVLVSASVPITVYWQSKSFSYHLHCFCLQPSQPPPLQVSGTPTSPVAESVTDSRRLLSPLTLTLIQDPPPSSSQTPPWLLGEGWLYLSPALTQFPKYLLHNPLHLHPQPLLFPSKYRQLPHIMAGDKKKTKTVQAQVLTLKFHLHLWQSRKTAQVWLQKGTAITKQNQMTILLKV